MNRTLSQNELETSSAFPSERLLSLLRAEMPHLTERFGVRSLSLFGSYVRSEATDQSDVDILVEYAVAPTLFEFVRLRSYLATVLGLPVDLVMRSALKPHIGQATLAELAPV